ncbi:hypothetical protein VP01_4868g1, partial [Puccinia sorghi]
GLQHATHPLWIQNPHEIFGTIPPFLNDLEPDSHSGGYSQASEDKANPLDDTVYHKFEELDAAMKHWQEGNMEIWCQTQGEVSTALSFHSLDFLDFKINLSITHANLLSSPRLPQLTGILPPHKFPIVDHSAWSSTTTRFHPLVLRPQINPQKSAISSHRSLCQ